MLRLEIKPSLYKLPYFSIGHRFLVVPLVFEHKRVAAWAPDIVSC